MGRVGLAGGEGEVTEELGVGKGLCGCGRLGVENMALGVDVRVWVEVVRGVVWIVVVIICVVANTEGVSTVGSRVAAFTTSLMFSPFFFFTGIFIK